MWVITTSESLTRMIAAWQCQWHLLCQEIVCRLLTQIWHRMETFLLDIEEDSWKTVPLQRCSLFDDSHISTSSIWWGWGGLAPVWPVRPGSLALVSLERGEGGGRTKNFPLKFLPPPGPRVTQFACLGSERERWKKCSRNLNFSSGVLRLEWIQLTGCNKTWSTA